MTQPVRPRNPPLPRLALLREMTDRAVLELVFAEGRTTRAELAARTGISKPTISESVRRLEAAGVLREGGTDATGKRGRVATFYELTVDAGCVLAVEVNQHGIHSLATDLTGVPFGERHRDPVRRSDAAALTGAVQDAVRETLGARQGKLRAVALSVANPVHPGTREIIALPDSPFPEGEVPLQDALADLVQAPVLVDNDVNFSALAERRAGAATDAESFAYVYVGAGLGLSLYLGDQLVRGAHGLSGEIGYLRTTSGAPVAEAVARQGFGRQDDPALDVDAVLKTLTLAGDGDAVAQDAVRLLGETIGQAIAATCVIFDPELVLLGGPVGGRPELLAPVRAVVSGSVPGPVRVEPGAVQDSAALRGALLSALDTGRAQLTVPNAGADRA
ncbi:ROK family transcriptional regulator [Amycolatopsis nigrescens]|uniref:ROK family transcriptional regulator n=1 Tax=Amycolatopsis nigrescens TaxID=381445 RepID=UPI00035DCB46|nr:ROK family transcriptional regulator [Amycolatopsis nigrescens]